MTGRQLVGAPIAALGTPTPVVLLPTLVNEVFSVENLLRVPELVGTKLEFCTIALTALLVLLTSPNWSDNGE